MVLGKGIDLIFSLHVAKARKYYWRPCTKCPISGPQTGGQDKHTVVLVVSSECSAAVTIFAAAASRILVIATLTPKPRQFAAVDRKKLDQKAKLRTASGGHEKGTAKERGKEGGLYAILINVFVAGNNQRRQINVKVLETGKKEELIFQYLQHVLSIYTHTLSPIVSIATQVYFPFAALLCELLDKGRDWGKPCPVLAGLRFQTPATE